MGATSVKGRPVPQRIPKRGNVYYHRRVIPNDLKVAMGIKERWVTLDTKEIGEARARWRKADYDFELYLADVRRQVHAGSWRRVTNTEASSNRGLNRSADDDLAETMHWHDDQILEESGLPYEPWSNQFDERMRQYDFEHQEEERRSRKLSLIDVFDRYASQPGRRPATVRQWRGYFLHLIRFLHHDNVYAVKSVHLRRWRDQLADETGPGGKPRTAKTINDSYLTSIRAVFAWAVDRDILADNPAKDVKPLRADRPMVLRDRDLTKAEQRMILAATLAPPPTRLGRFRAATRRWVPWLCAYTGARVAEITQLRADDIAEVDGVWTLRITPEAGTVKTKRARVVPLHDHLIEQGFLEFAAKGVGPLFYEAREKDHKPNMRPRAAIAANRLAEWVRGIGVTDVPQPNHAWRHTFKTISRTIGIPEGAADYIQGHSPSNDSRTYGAYDLELLSNEINKMPRFCCSM